MPYKAKNWHALSHEQCFSKHSFLSILSVAFTFSVPIWGSVG